MLQSIFEKLSGRGGMVDALDLGSSVLYVRVQVSLSAF